MVTLYAKVSRVDFSLKFLVWFLVAIQGQKGLAPLASRASCYEQDTDVVVLLQGDGFVSVCVKPLFSVQENSGRKSEHLAPLHASQSDRAMIELSFCDDEFVRRILSLRLSFLYVWKTLQSREPLLDPKVL